MNPGVGKQGVKQKIIIGLVYVRLG
jgi:hypothetical protein